jgi:hypothetical protein
MTQEVENIDIEKDLIKAFESEDRAGFEVALQKYKGTFPTVLTLPTGWKRNPGVVGENGVLEGLNKDQSIKVILRSLDTMTDPARYFRWDVTGNSDDILAYFVYSQG